MGTVRLFTAVDLTDEVMKEVVQVQDRLGNEMKGVKWTEPENMHVTVKFLGSIQEDTLPRVQAILDSCTEAHSSFRLQFTGVGQFPERGKPKIIWAGVREQSDGNPLQSCFEHLDADMTAVGVDRETRNFHPHVTIGRVKDRSRIGSYQRAMEAEEETRFGEIEVTELILYESELSPEGARHTVRYRAAMKDE